MFDKNTMQILFVCGLVVLLYFLGQYCSTGSVSIPGIFEGLENQEEQQEGVAAESAPQVLAQAPPQEGGVEPSRPQNEVFMPVGETASPYGLSASSAWYSSGWRSVGVAFIKQL